jgi:hypothetical protein
VQQKEQGNGLLELHKVVPQLINEEKFVRQ